jgi:hypothetical protein
MLLSCRFLIDVAGVNTFQNIAAAEMYAGDTQNLYIQLTDASLDRVEQGFSPAGRRYCPPSGTTLSVTFKNVDDAKVVVRTAVQAFPTLDASIWYIPILSSDPLAGTVAMAAVLTEPGPVVRRFANAKGVILRVK